MAVVRRQVESGRSGTPVNTTLMSDVHRSMSWD